MYTGFVELEGRFPLHSSNRERENGTDAEIQIGSFAWLMMLLLAMNSSDFNSLKPTSSTAVHLYDAEGDVNALCSCAHCGVS